VLSRTVSELRHALGDDSKAPRYIQTIPKGGYRLIAPVRDGRQPARPAVTRFRARRTRLAAVAITVLGLAIAALWWEWRQGREQPPLASRPLELVRLTANPEDLSVFSARISLNGRYLAYTDPSGIEVRSLDTGETHLLPQTVYAWTADSTSVRAGECQAGKCVGWDVSLIGGDHRRSGAEWSVGVYMVPTPDGSRLLNVDQAGRLTVDLENGQGPQRVPEPPFHWPIGKPAWSSGGTRVLMPPDDEASIVSQSLQGGPVTTIFKAEKGLNRGRCPGSRASGSPRGLGPHLRCRVFNLGGPYGNTRQRASCPAVDGLAAGKN
jgi:hypothetical protein